jgi:hypothetical protein
MNGRSREEDPKGPPPWDSEFAAQLIGKTLLVGIAYLDAGGELIEEVQFYGVIVNAGPEYGITINCQGEHIGQTYNMPPDLRWIEPAEPGEYRLRSTGEIVVDPDYTTTWTRRKPAS